MKVHESLVHRGAKVTKEEYNKLYGEDISKEACVSCKMYNPIRVGRTRDINAFNMDDKVLFDIISPLEEMHVITAIDYFTRYWLYKSY